MPEAEEARVEHTTVTEEVNDVILDDNVDEEIYVDYEPEEENYEFDYEEIEKKKKKFKKYLAIGAAVAAVAGIAYLISKAFRDNK